jgi:molybdopterin synthase catalytic subunit
MTTPSSSDWIQLSDRSLSSDAATTFVNEASAGGVCVFLGTTRAENNAEGVSLAALDYEAYPEMALAKMKDLALRARANWPIVKLALHHRTGLVAVGKPSVVIAVSAAHRAAAFEACRWLIDTLKAEVPIWKKEVWEDGRSTWVEGTEVRCDE